MSDLGFWGFRRPDGRVGVRNHVAVISAMDLSNSLARKICALVRGVVPILPHFGRLLLGADAAQHARTLIGVGGNPNVFGALVVSLEPESAQQIAAGIKETGKPVELLDLQSAGGSLHGAITGARLAGELIRQASAIHREWFALREIAVGLKCGGSDTTSGLAANPVIGEVVDRVIDAGGTVLFSEQSELIGAEEAMAERCAPETLAGVLGAISRMEKLAFQHKIDVRGINPTPDNIAGGITTVEEKAFGSLAKTGTRPIRGVVSYAIRPSAAGLWLMDGSGPAVELMSGLAASGAAAILFSTGVGNPVGSPIAPTVRVTAHPGTAGAWENVDFDASAVTLGEQAIEQSGGLLFHHLLRVLSGELTKCEVFADEEFAISRLGEAL